MQHSQPLRTVGFTQPPPAVRSSCSGAALASHRTPSTQPALHAAPPLAASPHSLPALPNPFRHYLRGMFPTVPQVLVLPPVRLRPSRPLPAALPPLLLLSRAPHASAHRADGGQQRRRWGTGAAGGCPGGGAAAAAQSDRPGPGVGRRHGGAHGASGGAAGAEVGASNHCSYATRCKKQESVTGVAAGWKRLGRLAGRLVI